MRGVTTKIVYDEKAYYAAAQEVGVKATHEVAREVAVDAIENAPKKTGRLAASIHAIGNEVHATAPYAVPVELGHRIVAWGNETGKFQPPQPYLRPALFKRRDI